jgi:hypothetical protein
LPLVSKTAGGALEINLKLTIIRLPWNSWLTIAKSSFFDGGEGSKSTNISEWDMALCDSNM